MVTYAAFIIQPRYQYAVTEYKEVKAQTRLEHLTGLDVRKPAAYVRLTGIMATIGPASRNPDILENMIAAGMNIARLNCAFETRQWRSDAIVMLREAAARYGNRMGCVYPLAIAIDLRGPIARTGFIDPKYNGKIELNVGDLIKLTTDRAYYYIGSPQKVYVNFQSIPKTVEKGDLIFLDDQRLRFRVESVSRKTVSCIAETKGTLVSQRDIKFRDNIIDLPTYSVHDEDDIEFALQNNVDIIIVSYVQDALNLVRLRELLGDKGEKTAIVCKLQNAKGFYNLDEIMKNSDSILISRYQLAKVTDPVKLTIMQKHVIARAMVLGKPCGVHAQMIHTQMQLKIELLDAGICVLDGADYLLLTAETSYGQHPVEAVTDIARAAKEAESCIWYRQLFIDLVGLVPSVISPIEGTAMAAAMAAHKLGAAFICVVTTDGYPARLVARFRPQCPVLAITRHVRIARHMHMCRGVVPLLYDKKLDSDWAKDISKRINFCLQFGFDRGFLKPGDPVIVVNASRQNNGVVNTLRIVHAREMEPGEHLALGIKPLNEH